MRPNDRKYLKTHEWCKIENGVATLGITDHAVAELSDLVFLDLPAPGAAVTAGQAFGEIESVKAVHDLYSGVSGKVIESNDTLTEDLETLARDPFGAGWMVKIQVTGESPDLVDAAAYEELIEAED
jgi:glycine cleavage system H protein